MHDQLLGYLFDALEDSERAEVEQELEKNPQLSRQLQTLQSKVQPLQEDRFHHDPPAGLAARTCEHIAQHEGGAQQNEQRLVSPARGRAAAMSSPTHGERWAAPMSGGRWSWADAIVAAGVFIAASLLFFPALSSSRFQARVANCQNNMRLIGEALLGYSGRHGGSLVQIPQEGNLSVAGVYAPVLYESGYLTDPYLVICTSSEQAESLSQWKLPELSQVKAAKGSRLALLQKMMGGSYGYTLGFMVDGKYRALNVWDSADLVLLTDAPSLNPDNRQSANHAGRGQNVLYSDGRVRFVVTCTDEQCGDAMFVNRQGQVAAGLDSTDIVIGRSNDRPLVKLISQ